MGTGTSNRDSGRTWCWAQWQKASSHWPAEKGVSGRAEQRKCLKRKRAWSSEVQCGSRECGRQVRSDGVGAGGRVGEVGWALIQKNLACSLQFFLQAMRGCGGSTGAGLCVRESLPGASWRWIGTWRAWRQGGMDRLCKSSPICSPGVSAATAASAESVTVMLGASAP